MLCFEKLTLADIGRIRPYFAYSENKTCDNTVGVKFMWRDFFSTEYAEFDGTLIFKLNVAYHGVTTAFAVPLGKDIRGAMREIDEYCRFRGMPVAYCNVAGDDMRHLRAAYGDIVFHQETGWSDYLYRAEDLRSLAGRKYSGQRNHINYFRKTHGSYSFEEITKDNIGEAKDFYSALSFAANKNSDIFCEDRKKTLEVLDNYEAYGLFGGLLRADGAVVAFSVGEILRNVLFIHIEKADVRARGAYQVISNEFAGHFASPDIEFINREEDAGDEGLRISKMSYHPCEMIDKYVGRAVFE